MTARSWVLERATMSPQPVRFSKVGLDVLADIPDHLASQAVYCIAAWSYVDIERTSLMSKMVKLDFPVIHAALDALTSTDARRAAIRQAAKSLLCPDRPDDFALFEAVERDLKAVDQFRNHLVHHLWVKGSGKGKSLTLLDPRSLTGLRARMKALGAKAEGAYEALSRALEGTRAMSYGEKDFDFWLKEMWRSVFKLQLLGEVVSAAPEADEARERLAKLLRGKLRPPEDCGELRPSPASEGTDPGR